MLTLSLLLNGCGGNKDKKVTIGNGGIYSSKVEFSSESINGVISAENMKYVKILTFTVGDSTFTKLVGLESGYLGSGIYETVYTDLDTGVTLIEGLFNEQNDYASYTLGEDLTIVSEEEILPYLYEAGMFQDDYDVNDVITFFHDEIESNLESNQTLTLEK